MGLLSQWLGGKESWNRWKRQEGLQLVFDAGNHSLNEMKIGDTLEQASFLGIPGDIESARDGALKYPELGLEINLSDEGLIEGMAFYWQEDGFQSFQGTFLKDRHAWIPSRWDTESQWLELMGHPWWENLDEYEKILFYEFNRLEWQVEFSLSGNLSAMVVSRPLLESLEQREYYGVTKPWPPSHL